jgi:hypothetical protein
MSIKIKSSKDIHARKKILAFPGVFCYNQVSEKIKNIFYFRANADYILDTISLNIKLILIEKLQ